MKFRVRFLIALLFTIAALLAIILGSHQDVNGYVFAWPLAVGIYHGKKFSKAGSLLAAK